MKNSIPLLLVLGTSLPRASFSAPASKAPPDAKSSKTTGFEALGLPAYVPPVSFREDLTITTKERTFTINRFLDHGRIRTEMEAEGNKIVMLEMGDEKGTIYTIMPGEKRVMKQTREGMEKARAKSKKKDEPEESGEAAAMKHDLKVEDLGDATWNGATVKKVRMSFDEGNVVGWFDKGTGAPLRMENEVKGEKSTLDWKRTPGSQSADLFVVPKDYEVTDMDEMYAKMASMSGMGGIGGMAKGMAGGMVQGMGGSLGGGLGATIGGSLGGPLGAAAGQFLGGKIGGMVGKKAASAIN